MISIREGVFETNSSSTHSLVIPKIIADKPSKIVFTVHSYGWEERKYKMANYIYTYILCDMLAQEDGLTLTVENIRENKYIKAIEKVLAKNGISCTFRVPKKDDFWGEYDFWIDHRENLFSTFSTIIGNEELLYRCLVGGTVYTGNDNSCDYSSMCYCALESFNDYDKEAKSFIKVKNENNHPETYEYFYKGN